jgi:hypothetical protein
MDSKRVPRKILYNTLGDERPVGKPKGRWNEEVEENPKILGIRNWKRYTMDRRVKKLYTEGQGPISGCCAVQEEQEVATA